MSSFDPAPRSMRMREGLSGRRRRLWVVVAVLCLAGVLAYHHSVPSAMDGMSAGSVCLGVIGGGIALLAPALGERLRSLPGPPARRPSRAPVRHLSPRAAPSRAGPIYLRLAVLRR
ncbi:MAG TPA: hypothetical protein VGC32_12690 [Solirubrobacterales bacterium]